MIHVYGIDKNGSGTTIELSPESEPAEIELQHEGEAADISKCEPHLLVDGKEVPVSVDGNILIIDPKNVTLPNGLFNFFLTLDKEVVLKGYFKWNAA